MLISCPVGRPPNEVLKRPTTAERDVVDKHDERNIGFQLQCAEVEELVDKSERRIVTADEDRALIGEIAGDQIRSASERELAAIDYVGIKPHDRVLADDFTAGSAVRCKRRPRRQQQIQEGPREVRPRGRGHQISLEFELGRCLGRPLHLNQAVVRQGILFRLGVDRNIVWLGIPTGRLDDERLAACDADLTQHAVAELQHRNTARTEDDTVVDQAASDELLGRDFEGTGC